MRFIRGLLILFAFTVLFTTVTKQARADNEFDTDYKVKYQVDKSGLTHVTQNINLKNKTPNFYADKFELKIGSTKVVDISARDDIGNLDTQAKFENNVTTIEVKFKQKVIGLGKSLNWNLSYSSDELVTKSGQIWEVSIPRLAKSADTGTYEASVLVPKIMGPVAFAIPTPISTQESGINQEFFFNKDQLLTNGIAMSFGEKQVFSFKLNYYIENLNLTAQLDQISLPPDNNYQKIVLEKIDPKPIDVVVDDDGNFLAKYRLAPKQKVTVKVEGHVEVFSKPFRKIIKSITPEQKELYTQPQQYWETDNASIKEKAQELKTPEKIYEFVSSYLSYNNQRLNDQNFSRKGATAAFATPKDAVCIEFTDLFIALARAANIPTREVEGYAYTQNERLRPLSLSLYQGDILHAWPEYWDNEKGWVQVDPTWGATSGGLDYFNKLDFNHITFVQRGISSTTPYPAGAYTQENNKNEKTVFVSFAQNLPNPTSANEIVVSSPDKIFAILPLKIKATVKNTGTTSILGEKLLFSHDGLKSKSQDQVEIAILPPFSNKSFDYLLETNNVLSKFSQPIILSYAGSQYSKSILVEPIYMVAVEPTFLFAVFGTLFILLVGLFLYKKTHKKVVLP